MNAPSGLAEITTNWDRFCDSYEEIARANTHRIREFLLIREALVKLGIRSIPLKGLDFLIRSYRSLGERPMADADLLIQKNDIEAVARFFESRGYRRLPDEGLTYVHPETGLNFDICWDIWYLKNPAKPFEKTVTVSFEGANVELLNPEDSLAYYICYVAANRCRVAPVFARDLEIFLEANDTDWGLIVSAIKEAGLSAACFEALRYAAEKGFSQIPQTVFDNLKPRTLSERFRAHLYRRMANEEGSPKVSYLFTWLSYAGTARKLRLLREKLLPTLAEWRLHGGNGPFLSYLFHLASHPFKIAFKGTALIIRDIMIITQRRNPHGP